VSKITDNGYVSLRVGGEGQEYGSGKYYHNLHKLLTTDKWDIVQRLLYTKFKNNGTFLHFNTIGLPISESVTMPVNNYESFFTVFLVLLTNADPESGTIVNDIYSDDDDDDVENCMNDLKWINQKGDYTKMKGCKNEVAFSTYRCAIRGLEINQDMIDALEVVAVEPTDELEVTNNGHQDNAGDSITELEDMINELPGDSRDTTDAPAATVTG